jgi:hypothetical protein
VGVSQFELQFATVEEGQVRGPVPLGTPGAGSGEPVITAAAGRFLVVFSQSVGGGATELRLARIDPVTLRFTVAERSPRWRSRRPDRGEWPQYLASSRCGYAVSFLSGRIDNASVWFFPGEEPAASHRPP